MSRLVDECTGRVHHLEFHCRYGLVHLFLRHKWQNLKYPSASD